MSGDRESFHAGLEILAEEVTQVLEQIRAMIEAPLDPGERIMAVSFGLMVASNEEDKEYNDTPGTEVDTELHLAIAGAPMMIGLLTQQMARRAAVEISRRNSGGDIREDGDGGP